MYSSCLDLPDSPKSILEHRLADDGGLMWLGKCFAAAKGYAFAALRNGTECWYGNN